MLCTGRKPAVADIVAVPRTVSVVDSVTVAVSVKVCVGRFTVVVEVVVWTAVNVSVIWGILMTGVEKAVSEVQIIVISKRVV